MQPVDVVAVMTGCLWFSIESLATAARVLGREPCFTIGSIHEHRVVIPPHAEHLLDRIDRVARASIRHWGVATVEDVAASSGAAVSFTRKLLSFSPGFKWLDEASGWFWIENVPRNPLLSQIRKILAACSRIDVGELRTGVGRHHRKKGFAPPRRVLLELCRQLPWCHVDRESILAAAPLNGSEILSETEQKILGVLKEHGPVLQRVRFEKLCLEAGINVHSFWIYLSYSPLICRHATGVYGLRGAEVPLGVVESLIAKRVGKSRLLVDYGWADDRKIQILYRLSEGMLTNGIVSIPSALKAFIQGRFTLMTGDGSKIGTLVVKNNSGWGLGPFFSRRGGEPGDYLSIVLDPSNRVAFAQIGDSGIGDKMETLSQLAENIDSAMGPGAAGEGAPFGAPV
jgi:hypothetical protein